MQFSNGNICKKLKRATKSKTSNQGHLRVSVFETELILSQKTRTSSEEQQKATNGELKHAPNSKPINKKQQRVFFIPSFIHLLQL